MHIFSQLIISLRVSSKEYKRLQDSNSLAIDLLWEVPSVPDWRLNGPDQADQAQFPKPTGEQAEGALSLHAVERKCGVLHLCITSENKYAKKKSFLLHKGFWHLQTPKYQEVLDKSQIFHVSFLCLFTCGFHVPGF